MDTEISPKPTTEVDAKKLKRQKRMRTALRIFGNIFEKLLTRTVVTGLENIPKQGPVLFGPNHFSTYDALILLIHLPKTSQLVGPGDFKLLWPANLVVENLGLILTDRGSVDRHSLKQMEDVLKNNGMLGLFPEGGTWEKGIHDVKSGAAYLSMVTGATIVPMSLGGTYWAWDNILHLKRPRITIHFGEPIPPIQTSGNRKTRQQELQQASEDLIDRVYANLPPEDQKLYDDVPRKRYRAELEFMPDTFKPENIPALSGLTELISKPNLFYPLHRNAKLPCRPFVQRKGQFTPAREFQVAVLALQEAFNTTFKGYLEYRLGDEKAVIIRRDFEEFLPLIEQAIKADVAIKYKPVEWMVEDGQQ